MGFVWMYCSVWLAVEVMFGGGEPNVNRREILTTGMIPNQARCRREVLVLSYYTRVHLNSKKVLARN